MEKTENSTNPDIEFYQELLLQRFRALRQQKDSTQVKSEVERIELALSRIRWGNYRNCMKCDEDIGGACLIADPTILYCPNCVTANAK